MVRAQTVVAVLATGALLGAGGAFAANKVLVKGSNVVDGSLTGKDIKNNSLTGVDIRNGSVQQADLSAALRTRLGQIGSGSSGAQGAAGPQGPPGPQGPAGVTAAASSKLTTAKPLGTTAVELIAQDTATGGYTGVATVEVTGSGAATVTCTLKIGANTSQGSATVASGQKVTIPAVAAGVLDTPGKVTLSCTADAANASATGAALVVTRIQNVTTDGY